MKFSSDIIILGGGNTGCPLAQRLAEKYSVNVLEAGYDQTDDPAISTPSLNGSLVLNGTNRYFVPLGHATTDVPNPLNNQRFPGVEGETPGGGSTVNGMQFVESDADYYNNLAQLLDDPDWSAANAAKVFKRMQTFNGIGDYNPDAHGYKGPLDVKQVVLNQQAAELFSSTTAAVEGIPLNIDYNDLSQSVGTFRYWQVTETPDSKRADAFSAYLKDDLKQLLGHPNVYVSTKTCKRLQFVTRSHFQQLHFDTSCGSPKVVGVTVSLNGHCVKFTARKYVILSTGFQTSAFLQNSGIGDAVHLKSLGIDVVVDNPNVGRHMHNHPILSVTGLVDPAGENPFTPLPPDYDTQGLYSGGAVLPDAAGKRIFQFIGIASPTIVDTPPSAFTIAGLHLTAKSQGYIKIIDRDINRIPEFDFNYLSDPEDLTSMVDLYTRQYNVLKAMGLLPQGPDPVSDPAGVETYVKTRFSQAYHWTGMNRMAKSRSEGVVTNDCRVFGTKNLYVADISVMPTNPLGNTQAIAYLVGNIVADKLIRKLKCHCHHHHRYVNLKLQDD